MMSDQYKTRIATKADLTELLALYLHLTPNNTPFDVAKAEAIFQDFMRYHGSGIFVAERDGQLVSSCTLVVVPNLTRHGSPYGLIENVVTRTDCRNQGYGKAMLDVACRSAWDNGCYKVMLMTGSGDPATLGFYQAAGFEQSKTGFQKRRR